MKPSGAPTTTPARPVVLVAHGGLIAALTAALLRLPVGNWPALGGMGNASWTQLSGHSVSGAGADGAGPPAPTPSTPSGGGSTCGTHRHRLRAMSSESRPTLLVFADSLAYYGPDRRVTVRRPAYLA